MHRFKTRRFHRAAGVTALAAAALMAPASAHAAQDYIVTLQPATGVTCDTTIRDVSIAYSIAPKYTYTASLCGFSASLAKRTVEQLLLDSRVKSVTQDGSVSTY
jgi:hypothetical protein